MSLVKIGPNCEMLSERLSDGGTNDNLKSSLVSLVYLQLKRLQAKLNIFIFPLLVLQKLLLKNRNLHKGQ